MIIWIILLFVAGVSLIVAEFFIPGLICGIVGGLCLIGGAGLGIYHYPDYAFLIVIVYVMGAFGAIMGGVLILPRTSAGRRMVLQDSITADADWVSDVSDESLIGAEGTVCSDLRPVGTVSLNGRRYSAVSTGEYIERDQRIQVVEVRGNRVVVEQLTTESH